MKSSKIMITKGSTGYELIDSGDSEKLERFGDVVLSRPDPQALWRKHFDETEWKKASGHFTRSAQEGKWVMKPRPENTDAEKKWAIDFSGLKFWIKPTAFKHTGLFPEQSTNWDWLRENITAAQQKKSGESEPSIEILNLFGYTGGATLACAQAGAHVVHIDSSKSAITWARENAELSGLADKPVRWILEDARLFVEREVKRGRKYDGIIMDPPSFGHGLDKDVWKIEEHLLPLFENCVQLLKEKPLFVLMNGYSAGYSAIAYENILRVLVKKYGGSIEIGELAIEESSTKGDGAGSSRLLPAGIFARWSAVK
ncbi:MAG: class I SAM-dependent methyltransferase [bacterium]